MRRFGIIFLVIIGALNSPALAVDPDMAHSDSTDETVPPFVTVVVRHRVVADFADTLEVSVGSGEQVWIGDTEYSLEIERFVPDFGINQKGEVVERGDQPCNPACHYVIYNEGEEEDTGWAFFGTGAPHFRRDSILSVDMVSFPWGDKLLTEPRPRGEN